MPINEAVSMPIPANGPASVDDPNGAGIFLERIAERGGDIHTRTGQFLG